jgi:serine/threonine protein kinase
MNYNILKELGHGGMATVYLAQDKKFDTEVAIKFLNKEFVNNENIRKRFIAEAKNMFKMSHPNIIKVTDLIDEGDTVAFVMEHIDGETLKEYLDRKGKLGDEEIRNIFSQMLDAVGYVHEQGLVHRDIKPSNFMIDKKGKVKLLDFGIAKNTDTSSAEYTQTGTGMQMGTPMYMSPEQVKNTKDVTPQSDIYSLGVILWQLVMGKRPYDGDTLSTFEIQLKIFQEPLAKTNTTWDNSIQKATEKNSNQRFSNAEEFKSALNSSNKNSSETDATVIIHKEEKTIVQKQNHPPTYINKYGMEFIFVDSTTFYNEANGVEETDDESEEMDIDNELNYLMLDFRYYIGKYPITQAQWEKIMGKNPSFYKNKPINPVDSVNWYDCQEFISKLNQRTGEKYRLPSSNEWVYAAQGGDLSMKYEYSGSNNVAEVAWYDANSNSIKKVEKKSMLGLVKTYEEVNEKIGTSPVGLKKPNELGIHDMSGNVLEWTNEWCNDWKKLKLRGGSFNYEAESCKLNVIRCFDPICRYSHVGFRLLLQLEED